MKLKYLYRILYSVILIGCAIAYGNFYENNKFVLMVSAIIGVILFLIDFLYIRKGDIKKDTSHPLWKMFRDFFDMFI
jgi:hypothetical protein